jgi:outer membrane protein insertion porin family
MATMAGVVFSVSVILQAQNAAPPNPTVLLRSIEFVGNEAISSGTLRQQMKVNRERNIWARMFGGPHLYDATKFGEDAQRIAEYYRDRGFISVRVGPPELTAARDSTDKKTRVVDVRIPIVEGHRYKVGSFDFDGNTVLKKDALRQMFDIKEGTDYSEQAIRHGLMKARAAYGAAGYYGFTGYPDFRFRNVPNPLEPAPPQSITAESITPDTGPPTVDITMRLQEGLPRLPR